MKLRSIVSLVVLLVFAIAIWGYIIISERHSLSEIESNVDRLVPGLAKDLAQGVFDDIEECGGIVTNERDGVINIIYSGRTVYLNRRVQILDDRISSVK